MQCVPRFLQFYLPAITWRLVADPHDYACCPRICNMRIYLRDACGSSCLAMHVVELSSTHNAYQWFYTI